MYITFFLLMFRILRNYIIPTTCIISYCLAHVCYFVYDMRIFFLGTFYYLYMYVSGDL